MTKYEEPKVVEPKKVNSKVGTSDNAKTPDGFAWVEIARNLYKHVDKGIVYLKFDATRRLSPAKVTDIVSTSHGFVQVTDTVKINFNATTPKSDD